MLKKCISCGKMKNVKEFSFVNSHQDRSEICKECEKSLQDKRAYYHKQHLKMQIKKNWTELCEVMDFKELDCELYNLKKIWEQVQEHAK